MDKMLGQAVDLVWGALPTMLILVFLYLFLRVVFFKPLAKVLKDRFDATAGSQQAATASIAAAEAKAAEHAAAIAQARTAIHKAREVTRQDALKARADLAAQTRTAANERIQAAKSGIQSDVATARQTLGDDSKRLAESIARKILG